ncbi:hypothetical protein [Curtobacterium sp. MCBD17_008]|uniref:hypothetical protein n=1 Tax=Curtobacterium sp. MCBD17_008 TaxID=2175656 RepID=UPI000DA8E13B|nr:hypothetical protein [Curtobacterium sp. MCBD17_008]PZE96064.1 hypothetical protein DEI95_01755 [Curtobacterium sp. MCBD17_008]
MTAVDDARTTADTTPSIAIDRDGGKLSCPRCSRPLRVARNQYYGVGLAVHEWLHVCPNCPWFAFAPSPTVEAVVAGDRRLPRWVALLQRHGRHRRASR